MACKSLKKHRLADNLDMDGPMIKVAAGKGKNRKSFDIHKSLLQKCTHYFDAKLESDAGKKGEIVLSDECVDTLEAFNTWLYSGEIERPPTQVLYKSKPSAKESQKLEVDLRARFDDRIRILTDLYILAEKMAINDLMNKCMDVIQDGFFDYGTVFGPGQISKVFLKSKPDSKLRELVVAANVIHLDRGCSTLREEHMMLSMTVPGYFDYMLKWIGRNFHLMGRRFEEGYEICKNPPSGFTVLNRGLLCACHFHVHGSGEAHHGHDGCAVPFMSCDH
ncbi:hypothetical protein HYALB_00003927 [Hymenoscyphus albidus]|uniref:BTB domain-containing protein n=1 Tax=Hymenoscyphus albidus TaxID=595503 RepID=A0A9N9QA42_9HELO|nr:hypothetical protein HYALB_00003927 [Hymenoscyphus albidus]